VKRREDASFDKSDGGMPGSEAFALLPSKVATDQLAVERIESALVPSAERGLAPEVSDDELVLAVRQGDPRVGRLLYARLVRVIDATLARIIGPGQPEHDDLVQAVFEEVLRSLFKGQFKGRCKLTSWAASIACHLGLNAIRSRKTERRIFDHSADWADSGLSTRADVNPEPAIEARDEVKQLRAALATLSPGRAEAVLLHDALGYDLGEVAALTNSTEAAVQSRLSRGRRDLAERLLAQAKPRGDK
jgi:RNA polymerase sigma-70 factor, ECF subfamily